MPVRLKKIGEDAELNQNFLSNYVFLPQFVPLDQSDAREGGAEEGGGESGRS